MFSRYCWRARRLHCFCLNLFSSSVISMEYSWCIQGNIGVFYHGLQMFSPLISHSLPKPFPHLDVLATVKLYFSLSFSGLDCSGYYCGRRRQSDLQTVAHSSRGKCCQHHGGSRLSVRCRALPAVWTVSHHVLTRWWSQGSSWRFLSWGMGLNQEGSALLT